MHNTVLGFEFIKCYYIGGTIVGDELSDGTVVAENVLKYEIH